MSAPLPPKPTPRTFSAHADVVSSMSDRSAHDDGNNTSSSRSTLRKSIHLRRGTLTRQESKFLEELCDTGNEVEVQLAHQKLLDDNLFFQHEEGFGNEEFVMGREQSGLSLSSEELQLLEAAAASTSIPKPGANVRHNSVSSLTSSGSNNQCSARRQMMLETRRKSMLFGKMWKAHENGLAVSGNSSRRSMFSRRNSGLASLETGSRRGLPEIFRSSHRRLSSSPVDPRKTTTLDGKMDHLRRPSLKKIPQHSSRPRLDRLSSVGSRKSVTFGELPPSPRKSVKVLGSITDLQKATPVRSNSIASIPSLHLASSVHSSASIPSLPPISKAHRVFSDSSIKSLPISDITSVDGLREGRDASSTYEEKKSDEGEVPIPVKGEIPQDGGVGDIPPIEDATQVLQHGADLGRPVLMREASQNIYEGAGMEVTDFDAFAETKDPLNLARQMDSLVSFNDGASAISRSSSFDETVSLERLNSIFRRTSAAIVRSLSEDESHGMFLDGTKLRVLSDGNLSSIKQNGVLEEDASWQMHEDDLDYYDSWMVIKDEYENGYGGGGTLGFSILGTNADDYAAHPHVLSPPLMESLQSFLPFNKSGENYWMKYSLVRDGSSMHTFLQYARGAKYSILAIETVDGEVFGAFTGEPWRKNWNYFGNGESFLWRMRHTRREKSHSIIDQAKMESEIDVYPYTGENTSIQLCTHDMIAVGGGNGDASMPEETGVLNHGSPIKQHEWGFGLTIQSDMLTGTSSPCITFGSPSLSEQHADGSVFEIINIELWTLTPCTRLEDAEKLELGKLFLQQHSQHSQ